MKLQQALACWEHCLDSLNQETLIDCARTLGVEVKRRQAVFQSLCDVWEPVDAYVRARPEVKLGESVAGRALEMLRERDALAAELAKLRAQEPVAYLDYWKSDGTGIVRKQRTTGVPFFNHPVPTPAVPTPTPFIPDADTRRNDAEFAAQQAATAPSVPDEWREFVRDIADNYDCDADAHNYGGVCRACAARALLQPPKPTGG